MTQTDINMLVKHIEIGNGFPKACRILRIDIRQASKKYLTDAGFKELLDNAVYDAYITQLRIIEEYKEKQKFTKFDEVRQKLFNFVTEIVYWESTCTEDELDVSLYYASLIKYGNDLETISVSCGVTIPVLVEFVINNKYAVQQLDVMFNKNEGS